MPVTYYKRLRMEVDLGRALPEPLLPEGYSWIAWDDALLDVHAEVKYFCFRDELDSLVFPCLGDRHGCARLMREIRRKPGFLPEATWLIANHEGCLATIQGVVERLGMGSIQNVGVLPGYRQQGLGRALVLKALRGFHVAGLEKASLEVTAENDSAVRLYRALGFRKARVSYRAVDD